MERHNRRVWWNGSTDAAFTTTGYDIAVFGNGGAGGTVTLATSNAYPGAIVFNPVPVGGNYTLQGTNIYLGGNFSNVSTATLLGSGPLGTGASGIYDNAQGVTSITDGAFLIVGPQTFSTVSGGTLAITGELFSNYGSHGPGLGNINFVGSGVVSFTDGGANAFYSTLNVIGGTLNIADPGAIGIGGDGWGVSVGTGGAINVVNNTQGFAGRTYNLGGAVGGSGVINVNNAGSGISGGWVTVMNQWNQAFAGDAMPQLIFTGTININSGVFGTGITLAVPPQRCSDRTSTI